ncbi:MAG: cyclopropane fatty acyl phospholipid synthase [Gammaproteobacteria bacterium]|nr:cyclopropane fatty acyl phospholipid synthase [Pseudomonadales bacterium]
MVSKKLREKVETLLESVDIRIGGDRPWDLRIHDPRVFDAAASQGTIGVGEAYMEGWWDCEALDEFFNRILRTDLPARVASFRDRLFLLKSYLFNMQSGSRAFKVGRQHYDAGNDLYERMLDRRMIYSCGYWRDADTLDSAQEAKLDLVFRKLGLRPGMRILDIGCGWGGAAGYAAEKYGVEVVGVTISREQMELASERCRNLPVEIRLQDYHALHEQFDAIYSIGMFEHVGHKNYRQYFRIVRRCLADDGLFVLHTIGNRHSNVATDPWIEKYIFPNSVTPSIRLIGRATEDLLVMEDWQNFRNDYDRTLQSWDRNINRAWDELPDYDEAFRRMWHFYLMCSAGSFRSGNNQLWQIVFSKNGTPERYDAPR